MTDEYTGAASLAAPTVMLLALPLIKWDEQPTKGTQYGLTPNPAIVRGDLPGWLSWLSTPDERLPGSTGETDQM